MGFGQPEVMFLCTQVVALWYLMFDVCSFSNIFYSEYETIANFHYVFF